MDNVKLMCHKSIFANILSSQTKIQDWDIFKPTIINIDNNKLKLKKSNISIYNNGDIYTLLPKLTDEQMDILNQFSLADIFIIDDNIEKLKILWFKSFSDNFETLKSNNYYISILGENKIKRFIKKIENHKKLYPELWI